MLARVVTRPAATIRRGSQLQRRFIHPSRSQLQDVPRPNTWLAKIRFRADGKPRSKPIGLGFGSLILINLFLLHKLYKEVEHVTRNESYLMKVIHIQQTDSTYDSVNFDDPISTFSYFKKLYRSFSWDSEEAIDHFFEFLMQNIRKKTKKGSTESGEVQAHFIMRSAAEKIHNAFRELKPDSFLTTVPFVLLTTIEAMESLIALTRMVDGDDDDSV